MRVLARMIQIEPELVAEATFGEALLSAVRTCRRVVVADQDTLGIARTVLALRRELVRCGAS